MCLGVCGCGGSLISQKSAKLLQNLAQQKGYKHLLLVETVNSDLGYPNLSKRQTDGNGSNIIFSFFVFEIG